MSGRRCGGLAVLGVAALIALYPWQGIRWDGGFRDAEYRLTFVDEAGRPVPGVALRVLTRAGGPCPLYPVNEYLPDQAPASDADGRVVFHHVAVGIEFGGHESRNLVGMRFGDTDAPRYECVFTRAGREVYRVGFADLRPPGGWAGAGTVLRAWRPPDWPWRELKAHHADWDAHRRRLYDGNGDGDLDREERTAAVYFVRAAERAFEWRVERSLPAGHAGPPAPDERQVEFKVVERTVSLPPP